ncbi:hypothetical protein F5146DRAFT_180787 [Armillaria mellea]|nr:hypothetical protein F5146DRAFT_180787 [Armillaria mellea]
MKVSMSSVRRRRKPISFYLQELRQPQRPRGIERNETGCLMVSIICTSSAVYLVYSFCVEYDAVSLEHGTEVPSNQVDLQIAGLPYLNLIYRACRMSRRYRCTVKFCCGARVAYVFLRLNTRIGAWSRSLVTWGLVNLLYSYAGAGWRFIAMPCPRNVFAFGIRVMRVVSVWGHECIPVFISKSGMNGDFSGCREICHIQQ